MHALRSRIGALLTSLRRSLRQHRVLLAIIATLAVAAALTNSTFRGSLINPLFTIGGGRSQTAENWQACTSKGTVFENLTTVDEVVDTFKTMMSNVVAERQAMLEDSAVIDCTGRTDQEVFYGSQLETMANGLPALYVRADPSAGSFADYEPPQLTFASFSTVIAAFDRAYECKLEELRSTRFAIMNSSQADDLQTLGRVAGQAASIDQRIDVERARARIAIDRTLLTLRSFDILAPMQRQLTCLVRQEMDLKLELSLLADAVSCLPRIWDSATSLHDRSPDSPIP